MHCALGAGQLLGTKRLAGVQPVGLVLYTLRCYQASGGRKPCEHVSPVTEALAATARSRAVLSARAALMTGVRAKEVYRSAWPGDIAAQQGRCLAIYQPHNDVHHPCSLLGVWRVLAALAPSMPVGQRSCRGTLAGRWLAAAAGSLLGLCSPTVRCAAGSHNQPQPQKHC